MKSPVKVCSILLSLLVFLHLANTVLADCTCDQGEDDRNQIEALKFKLIALASILVAGGIGVALPFLGKIIPSLSPEKDIFFIIKAFAAGVILATGFVHILPDAFDSLTSPCLSETPWGEFPFTGLVAMVATMGTLLFECHSTAYQSRSHFRVDSEEMIKFAGEEEGKKWSHTHGPVVPLEAGSGDSLRQVNHYRIVSKVLELGIIVHSVIIGLSLGASQSPKVIKPLVAALTFHQFFEGMGLGGCISQAKFKCQAITFMGAFFTLTTPLGIVLGIILTNTYKENGSTALIVEGILNAASSGILIYMALVNLLSADFLNPRIQKNIKLHLGANISLVVGAGCMTLLAKWA